MSRVRGKQMIPSYRQLGVFHRKKYLEVLRRLGYLPEKETPSELESWVDEDGIVTRIKVGK